MGLRFPDGMQRIGGPRRLCRDMHEPRTPPPALATVGVAALILLACAVTTTAPALASDTPTPDELVAEMQRAATGRGRVLHTVTTTSIDGKRKPKLDVESWIDLSNDRMRQQQGFGIAVLVTDGSFSAVDGSGVHPPAPARNCPILGLAASRAGVCKVSSGSESDFPQRIRGLAVSSRRGRPGC